MRECKKTRDIQGGCERLCIITVQKDAHDQCVNKTCYDVSLSTTL